MRAPLLALLFTAAPLLGGCDLVFVLILSPFFPGQELPPPDDLTCPLEIAPADPGPLPDSFDPRPPALDGSCDVGAKAIHRLNRAELGNSLKDLLGVPLDVAGLPPDDFGAGFDNQADVLAVSPLLVEKLESVAADAVRLAMARPGEVREIVSVEAERAIGDGGRNDQNGTADIAANQGELHVQVILPNAAGTYAVRMRVGTNGGRADGELLVDGTAVLRTAVTADVEQMQIVEARVHLDKGPVHTVGARATNEHIVIDFFEVEGPFDVSELGPPPLARQRIVSCDLEALGLPCARDVVAGFARRAWRRPMAKDEIARFERFMADNAAVAIEEGAAPVAAVEDALRDALTAVLLSPHFLYRVELDPPGVAEAHALADHELATRLSYFLWASAPDERLLALSERGALQDPDVLEAEARRMIADPKSRALSESFAGQWLFTRAVDGIAPDPLRFPQFDESLRAAMKCETQLTFDRFLRDDTLDARDMLLLDETFVNERLAAHYGLEPPLDTLGHGWGLVSTTGTGRSGILTHAGILAVNSQPTRTSPTRRGKWMLENLLCAAPPPPPPEVEGLPEPAQGEETESLRERLEQHRSDPACISCHAAMDPLGLSLEHFDATGAWRASDAGFRIDDSGLYMDDPAQPFDGARGMAERMKEDGLLPHCMAQKAMTYALGRSIDEHICNVDEVAFKFAEGGYRMSDLLVEIVLSPSFRMRRAAGDQDFVDVVEAQDEVTP